MKRGALIHTISIQAEERATGDKIWAQLSIASRIAFNRIVGDATDHYRKAS